MSEILAAAVKDSLLLLSNSIQNGTDIVNCTASSLSSEETLSCLLSPSGPAPYKFDAPKYYEKMSADFGRFHENPINIVIHFVTSPMGMIGALCLVRRFTRSSSSLLALIGVYLLSLLPIVPNGTFAGTVVLSGIILYFVRKLRLNVVGSLAFIVMGYMLQDLSHWGTGEKTFQSTYSAGGSIDLQNPLNWARLLMEHCYYLLPLCVHVAIVFLSPLVPADVMSVLDAPLPDPMQQLHAFAWLLGPLIVFALGSYCLDSKNSLCFFPGTPYFHRVLRCSLTGDNSTDGNGGLDEDESRQEDLKAVRDWAMNHNPPESMSSHWWYRDLDGDAKGAFDRCSQASQIHKMFRSLFSERHYCMDTVVGMNEIYISGPARQDEAANSDHVFYSRHVDGPFALVPFVSVYRCIVGMDKNLQITTHFPLANINVNACEGDVLAFDFNREVHYISCDESKKDVSDKFRVVLKLHYCIYPRVLAPIGWLMSFLNVRYNMSFRALFLKTIHPASLYEHFLAWNVNFQTNLFDRIETLFGQRNVLYLMFTLALWRATGVYEVFFALTSFVHYFRYISTFYVRRGIDFGSFKRDVLLFKSLALIQMFYHYLFPSVQRFSLDFTSIAMILTGYVVSMMATNALGIDRTYFAAELGLVEPKWITQFPYGYIPHPMIVSQIFALLGLYKAAHFRQEWPYVVPIHITMYLIHMLQEEFNFYKRYPDPTTTTTTTPGSTPSTSSNRLDTSGN